MHPTNKYKKRIEKYETLLKKLNQNISLLSRLRLLTIIALIATAAITTEYKMYDIAWLTTAGFILVFAFFVFRHKKLRDSHKYLTNLNEISKQSIMRINGEWTSFKNNGEGYLNEEHNYSYDLDLFGVGSLFQLINTANTYIGKAKLASMLTKYNFNKETIIKKQQAIKELASKKWWRQRLQVEGKMFTEENVDTDYLTNWANSKQSLYTKPSVIITLKTLPIVTAVTLVLAYFSICPSFIPAILVSLQFVLLIVSITKRNKEFTLIYKYQKSIKAYRHILTQIDKCKFKSSYLKELKAKLSNNKNISAPNQLKKLERLVTRIGNRNNQAFFPINGLTLWDYQCLIQLEKFKSESGSMLKDWLVTIGEIEALCSFANIAYEFPQWQFPEITDQDSVIEAKNIAHPLLTNKQVANDITMQSPNAILLITGSNMSGKSTFLRTIGINLVLAYAGAPVCASYLKCSVFNINTCMRISDNLNKGLSSFYAELLRIKEIVEETKKDKQVFFLLDEIFKGTNSYDRHIGAKRLIKKLKESGAVGLVSTHDLELGDLQENQVIKNYHFQEYYENDEIKFDYKLKNGISKTRNALQLMKIIGID
ncbi:DNA mismatch repair protein [Clostridium sp. 'deep sea']|uniref:MutS-related protein n=1 Tax=Clostridium sp. 'deep sea' TaxID=2779445 RepID=UPI0018969CDD|nr:MutS family DNA mismatch repair protein [Clostridium sp. 'deep sea']QOR35997.1 DNA mismatch repair protein [Clostridium sp. 'deep sea']